MLFFVEVKEHLLIKQFREGRNYEHLEMALEEAKQALKENTYPIGAEIMYDF